MPLESIQQSRSLSSSAITTEDHGLGIEGGSTLLGKVNQVTANLHKSAEVVHSQMDGASSSQLKASEKSISDSIQSKEDSSELTEEIKALTQDLEKAKLSNRNDLDGNLMLRVRALINRVLEQLSDISQNERESINQLKTQYSEYTRSSASLQRAIGKHQLYTAIGCFIIQLGQFGFSTEGDRKVMQFISEQLAPSIGNLLKSSEEAEKGLLDARASLAMQDYSNRTAKNNDNNRNEPLQIFQAILDLYKKAGNG